MQPDISGKARLLICVTINVMVKLVSSINQYGSTDFELNEIL